MSVNIREPQMKLRHAVLYHSHGSSSCFVHRNMQLWYQLRAEELEHMQAAYFGLKGRNNNNNKKLRNKSTCGDVTNMAYDNQGFHR